MISKLSIGLAAILLIGLSRPAPAQPTPPCAPAPAGLVSWWRGEDDATDFSARNHGMLLNGATFADGKAGQALSFDGADDYVSIPTSPSLQFVTDFSVSVWAKSDNGSGTIVSRYDASCWNGHNDCLAYILRLEGGVPRAYFAQNGPGSWITGPNVDSGWHHYAITYSNALATLYVDGVAAGTLATGAPVSSRPIPTAIGANSVGTGNFDGLIDEVAIFQRVLTASQVHAIYDAGNAGMCPPPPPSCAPAPANLVSWWRAEDDATGFADGNHGTLNGPTFAAGKVGQAFSFDGADDYVSIPSSPALQFVTDFSISVWAKKNAFTSGGRIICRYDSSCWNGANDCLGYALGIGSDAIPRVSFASNSGNSKTCDGIAVDTNWHHYAVTYTDASAALYIDGVLLSTVATGQSISSRLIPTTIGSTSAGTENFDGLIDEIQIFARVLSAVEVQSIYEADSAGLCTSAPDNNQPPVAVCSGNITIEAQNSDGASVQLADGGSYDLDPGDTLTYHWDVSNQSVVLDNPDSPTPSGVFPVGVTMATLAVSDGNGGVATCDVLVTVQDTMPPQVMCTSDLAMLWPPNHEMRTVTLYVTGTDAVSNSQSITPLLVTLRSDEPDDATGNGDGATTGDVNGANGFTAPVAVTSQFVFQSGVGASGAWVATVQLRAERAGDADGRCYTIDVTARDTSGNQAITSCCIVVPHDRRR